MYPYFMIFDMKVSLFNLCIIAGIVISLMLFLYIERKRLNVREQDDLLVAIGITTPAVFLCAVMFNKIVFRDDSSLQNPFSYQGMTFFGGLIGGIVTFSIVHKIIFDNYTLFKRHLNIIAPYIVVAHICGRLGCFFAGCCYGRPTRLSIGVSYPQGSIAYNHYGDVNLIPTQLIEACYLALIFLILIVIQEQYRAMSYLLLYCIGRFFLEFLRGDNRGSSLSGLSPSQCICIIMIILIIVKSVFNMFLTDEKNST